VQGCICKLCGRAIPFDLGAVDQADVDHAASIINGQRRRSLNYQSPAALYAAAAVQ